MGDNYVLGTREEENCFVPLLVHPKMFFDCKIRTLGAGSQHIVVLTSAAADNDVEPKFDFSLPLPQVEVESVPESESEVAPVDEVAQNEEDAKESEQVEEVKSESSKKRSQQEITNPSEGIETNKAEKKLHA